MENSNEKTIGIIAYLTLIGWIIAIVMNGSTRSEYASFHIRQMLGLMLLSFLASLIVRFGMLGIISSAISILVLVLWAIAFVGAIQGQRKPIPFLGEQFQEWFKGMR